MINNFCLFSESDGEARPAAMQNNVKASNKPINKPLKDANTFISNQLKVDKNQGQIGMTSPITVGAQSSVKTTSKNSTTAVKLANKSLDSIDIMVSGLSLLFYFSYVVHFAVFFIW